MVNEDLLKLVALEMAVSRLTEDKHVRTSAQKASISYFIRQIASLQLAAGVTTDALSESDRFGVPVHFSYDSWLRKPEGFKKEEMEHKVWQSAELAEKIREAARYPGNVIRVGMPQSGDKWFLDIGSPSDLAVPPDSEQQ